MLSLVLCASGVRSDVLSILLFSSQSRMALAEVSQVLVPFELTLSTLPAGAQPQSPGCGHRSSHWVTVAPGHPSRGPVSEGLFPAALFFPVLYVV